MDLEARTENTGFSSYRCLWLSMKRFPASKILCSTSPIKNSTARPHQCFLSSRFASCFHRSIRSINGSAIAHTPATRKLSVDQACESRRYYICSLSRRPAANYPICQIGFLFWPDKRRERILFYQLHIRHRSHGCRAGRTGLVSHCEPPVLSPSSSVLSPRRCLPLRSCEVVSSKGQNATH